jgi:hypothetical protein
VKTGLWGLSAKVVLSWVGVVLRMAGSLSPQLETVITSCWTVNMLLFSKLRGARVTAGGFAPIAGASTKDSGIIGWVWRGEKPIMEGIK